MQPSARHAARERQLVVIVPLPEFLSDFLERVVVGLAGADAHGAIEVVDENLAVADLAGLGGVADRGDDLVLDAVRRRRLRS